MQPSSYSFECNLDDGFPTRFTARVSDEWAALEGKVIDRGINRQRVEGVMNRAYQGAGLTVEGQQVSLELGKGLQRIEASRLCIIRKGSYIEADIGTPQELSAAFASVNFWLVGVLATDDNLYRRQNTMFSYHPSADFRSHGIGMEAKPEFIAFATGQGIDEEAYERRAHILLERFWDSDIARYYTRYNQLFNWKGGLLTNVTVPGDRCGLDWDGHLRWGSHNCDMPKQAAAIFILANAWLNDIEIRISQ